MSTAGGESTLRGRVPDHAALYGLLARLRDLAIPLLAVRVLDAQAQLELSRQSRRYDLLINALLVALYLLLLGGLGAITVWVTSGHPRRAGPDPALCPARWPGPRLLAVERPGGLALAQLRGLAGGGQSAFLIFIPVSDVLPPELGIAITLFLLAGGLVYLIYALRRRAADVDARLAGRGTLPGRPAGGGDGGNRARRPQGVELNPVVRLTP